MKQETITHYCRRLRDISHKWYPGRQVEHLPEPLEAYLLRAGLTGNQIRDLTPTQAALLELAILEGWRIFERNF